MNHARSDCCTSTQPSPLSEYVFPLCGSTIRWLFWPAIDVGARKGCIVSPHWRRSDVGPICSGEIKKLLHAARLCRILRGAFATKRNARSLDCRVALAAARKVDCTEEFLAA